MNISDLIPLLELQSLHTAWQDAPVTGAYCSDLMSDVMANATEADVLITIQGHRNTVAVATLVGARGIIVCNNRPIPDDMRSAAEDEQIVLFVSGENQFVVSGKLYHLLTQTDV